MTPADSVDLEFSKRLSRGLRRIACAEGMEAVLLAATHAAHEVANAAGLCIISGDALDGMISTIEEAGITRLAGDSSLQRLIASAADGTEATIQYRPLLEVELPAGRRLRTQALLTVPLGADSGYSALAFFWREGAAPNAEQLALLPGVAWTSCLALRAQQDTRELRRSRAEQRSQVLEFQHRARNVLALVRSIIRRSSQSVEPSEEFASHMEGRISALARTQGALIIDGQMGPELEDLLRTELAANAVRDEQLHIAGPSLRLAPRAAETIALTLHELTTNALKFGALTAPEGRIEVSWNIASAIAHWSWIESNVRIEQPVSQRRGFGRELIERVLPYELGATTRFMLAADGVRCEIDLPINERTTAMAARA